MNDSPKQWTRNSTYQGRNLEMCLSSPVRDKENKNKFNRPLRKSKQPQKVNAYLSDKSSKVKRSEVRVMQYHVQGF